MMFRVSPAIRRAIVSVLALGTLLMLSGCYLPDRFQLNMNIDKSGKYAFIYEGDLIAFNFLRKIGQGEVRADDKEEIAVYVQDLERDSAFEEVTYLGNARYRVKYKRQSNILEHPSFSFVRRNAAFMMLKRGEDGLIQVEGDKPNKRYRDELKAKGYNIRGVVRVWTNARVLDHNAEQVIQGNPTQYVWDIQSFEQPTPKMTLVPEG
ncbi:hypothetical protein EOI86_14210 [Hwanghaeella grinnelliae]|uniref:Uncharacterized protein n=1 Tax=Hwanghaeella grinnelliae TaxID=2500179 RepID=A0A3S2VPH7_9PROT|nr:hypothetical protein [Hwanghaeella grinnelliae]RVU36361.1 hypothetical protein EOI86_14210 [Hwanghaeella grinnelliae]